MTRARAARKFSGARILLLSDLSRAGQNDLLSRTNDLHADIVVAVLPNEGEPLSDALLDAIQRSDCGRRFGFSGDTAGKFKIAERLEQRKVP